MTVSYFSLALGVLAYGVGAANLSAGSQGGVVNAVRSRVYWVGTALQGAGFLFTAVARHDLPMLLVQTCVVAAIAVTALIEHVRGVRPLTIATTAGIGLLILGVGAVVLASEPGHTDPPTIIEAMVLAGFSLLAAAAVPVRAHGAAASLIYGSASGLGFGISAVAARILMADAVHPPWLFWQLPLTSWLVAVFVPVGMLLGQVHLTRGLARGTSTPVLGCMYASATALAALLGTAMLDERLRPGMLPLVALGIVIGTVGTAILLRHEGHAPAPA